MKGYASSARIPKLWRMNFAQSASAATDYSDLIAPGMVTISFSEKAGVVVDVDGFEFVDRHTCREHAMKAMAWAADVLRQQVEAERLAPGGRIVSVSGGNQDHTVIAAPLVAKYKGDLLGSLFLTGRLPSASQP